MSSKSAFIIQSDVAFDVIHLNIGGAMDNKTGIFTVPQSGRYAFNFNCLKDSLSRQLHIVLRLNGKTNLASSYSGDYVTAENKILVPLTLHCIAKLKAGDKVALHLVEGTFLGSLSASKNSNSFTGFLIEQDLSFEND